MALKTILGMTSVFLMLFAIIGVSWWAFAPRRKTRFREDAMLPFADETELEKKERELDPKSDEPKQD